MLTEGIPRLSLAHLPTPLEEMPRLRQALGQSPRLLIKRDDQTGLATGGNKARKLEFLVADALEKGADTLVTTGAAQSNHCRQTAAAAAKIGLKAALVLQGDPIPRPDWDGNLLLDDLLGAELYWTRDREPDAVVSEVAEVLRDGGANPYGIPIGGSVPTGAAGYAAAVEELAEQLEGRDERVDRIVFSSGSGGTHAGLLVGVKALGMEVRLEGIQSGNWDGLVELTRSLANDTAAHLGLDLRIADSEVMIHQIYGTPGYGVITDAEREAIRLLAQTESIIADPVYTGRSLAGLIDLIRRGVYKPEETILYWHTGGTAGVFARAGELVA